MALTMYALGSDTSLHTSVLNSQGTTDHLVDRTLSCWADAPSVKTSPFVKEHHTDVLSVQHNQEINSSSIYPFIFDSYFCFWL